MTDPATCTCLRLADRLRAELEHRPPDPCALHEPDAYRQAEATRARADADDLAETLGVTVRDAEPEPDPLTAALARKVPPSNVVPLNAHPSAYDALRPYLNNPNPDGPTAA